MALIAKALSKVTASDVGNGTCCDYILIHFAYKFFYEHSLYSKRPKRFSLCSAFR